MTMLAEESTEAPPRLQPVRFSVEGKALAAALALIADVTPRRTTLPILECVRLSSSERGVTAHVTDLDMWATVPVSGAERGEFDGSAVLPYKPLRQLLKTQRGALTFVGRHVSGEGVSVSFADLGKGEDFPKAPDMGDGDVSFALPYADLQTVITKVAFAVSKDPNRPILHSVSMERLGERIEYAATNGHRLAAWEAHAPDGMPDRFAVLLTPKTLRIAVRLFKGQEELWCRITDPYVEFSAAGRTLIARLGEGPYPNYRQVIPKVHTRTVQVSIASLTGAVRPALVVAPPREHRIVLRLSGGDSLSIEASDLIGEVKVHVPAGISDSEGFALGFNALYLLDSLSRFKGGTVTFGLTKPEHAALLSSDEDEGFRQLLMPLRLL